MLRRSMSLRSRRNENTDPSPLSRYVDFRRRLLIFADTTLDAIKLRDEYLARKILTPKSIDDATDVALATIHRADAIVSWNFKHIVRLDKMKQYNQVNFSLGYGILEIVSPKEVVFDEKS